MRSKGGGQTLSWFEARLSSSRHSRSPITPGSSTICVQCFGVRVAGCRGSPPVSYITKYTTIRKTSRLIVAEKTSQTPRVVTHELCLGIGFQGSVRLWKQELGYGMAFMWHCSRNHESCTPHTLHLTPYTLQPTPCTLHPAPCTLHPTSCALRPAPCTQRH